MRSGEFDRLADRKRNPAEAKTVQFREDQFELANERLESRAANGWAITFGVHRVTSRTKTCTTVNSARRHWQRHPFNCFKALPGRFPIWYRP